jgi:hypothetical protein
VAGVNFFNSHIEQRLAGFGQHFGDDFQSAGKSVYPKTVVLVNVITNYINFW